MDKLFGDIRESMGKDRTVGLGQVLPWLAIPAAGAAGWLGGAGAAGSSGAIPGSISGTGLGTASGMGLGTGGGWGAGLTTLGGEVMGGMPWWGNLIGPALQTVGQMSQGGGSLKFKEAPQTPDERALYAYALAMSGMPGTAGGKPGAPGPTQPMAGVQSLPTLSYLGPIIQQMLQRNMGGAQFQPLPFQGGPGMPAPAQYGASAPVAPLDFQSLLAPWLMGQRNPAMNPMMNPMTPGINPAAGPIGPKRPKLLTRRDYLDFFSER